MLILRGLQAGLGRQTKNKQYIIHHRVINAVNKIKACCYLSGQGDSDKVTEGNEEGIGGNMGEKDLE